MRLAAWLLLFVASITACQDRPVASLRTPTPPITILSPAVPATSTPAELSALRFSAIQRVDSSTGFVAASAGTDGPRLARTTDGGATWQSISIPLEMVTTIRFLDARAGWVAGLATDSESAVLRTVDGGATWERSLEVAAAPGGWPPIAIQAIDATVAWVLVSTCRTCIGDLAQTSDGGHHWTWLTSGPITAMRFATAKRGWIAVDDRYPDSDIRVTSDGGRTWNVGARFSSGEVVGLDAADASTAWALIRDGAYCTASTCTKYDLERTTDGGLSWRSIGNPKQRGDTCSGGHVYGPLFVSPTTGWLVENSGAGGARTTTGLLHSEDGGATWRCRSAPEQTGAVSAADVTHLWVASGYGGDAPAALYASDDGGTTWRIMCSQCGS